MRRTILTAALALLLGLGTARAQERPDPPQPPKPPMRPEGPGHGPGPGPGGPSPEQHKELRKKIQAMRMARLTQELDLDEAAAAKLFPLVNRHDEKVNALMEDRGKIMRTLEQSVREGKEDGLPGLLEKLGEIEKAVHQADEATHAKVREILSASQAAKFFVFHEKFHGEVREFLEGARRDEEKRMHADMKAHAGEKGPGPGGPANVKAMLEKAAMAHKQGQLDDALMILEKAIATAPDDGGPYVMRAQILARKARLDDALESAERAIAINPQAIEPRAVKAHILFAKKDLKGARRECDRIIELDPRSAQGWILRGMAELQTGENDKAMEDFTRAIELNPKEAGAYRFRADARAQNGDREGAIADLQRAIEIDPKSPDAERIKKKIGELSPR